MKKYIYQGYLLLLLLITGLSACKKSDSDKFDKTPGQRSTEALNKYQTQLTSAPNGWKAILYPSAGGVYLFSIKFAANDRTTMLSDIDSTKSTTPLESGYIIKQLQAPSLVFDTYSYIHLLSDPDPNVQSGQAGVGYSSDFEFSFDKVGSDTITLIGNRNGSKLTLIKAATAAEYTSFTTATTSVFTSLNVVRTYFKRVTIGTTVCEVNIDKTNKILNLSYLDNGTNLKTVSSGFYVDGSTNVMVLINPVTIGATTITTIKTITGDSGTHTVNATINGTAMQIKEAIAPLKYDLTAVSAFTVSFHPASHYNNAWVSNNGFTVDNKIDAYGVRAIPGLDYVLYYPLTTTKEKGTKIGFYSNADGFFPYGPEIISSVSNGIISFKYWGSYGNPPAAIAPAVNSTTNKFLDPNGFYVIQTSPKTYDLVNATDARAWISFY